MVHVIIAVAAIAAAGYLVYKRVHAASVLFTVGVLLLFVAAFSGRAGHTSLDIDTTGNALYDELLVVEELFVSRFAGTGMAIMVLFGFVAYMRHIGADAKTVVLLARPLRRFQGSYWLVPLGFTVGTLLSLVVPSASALALLLVATLMPALIAAGLSPLTVGAIIVTASTIVPTPLEAGLIQGADLAGMSVSEFAFGYVAKATIPALVVTAFVHMWWQRRCDRKDAAGSTVPNNAAWAAPDSRIDDAIARASGLPGFYAMLPLMPLLLIIVSAVLNRVGLVNFEADIVPVTVTSLVITMIVESIRRRTVDWAIDDLRHFFMGIGEGAGGVVALIIGAAILVEGITQMGVIDALTSLAGDSAGAGAAVLLIFVAATGLMALLTGSGVAPYFAFSEMVPGIAAQSSVNAPQMLTSIWATSNTLRQASPVNAAVLIVAGALSVNPAAIVRRTIVPMFAATLTSVACSFVFL